MVQDFRVKNEQECAETELNAFSTSIFAMIDSMGQVRSPQDAASLAVGKARGSLSLGKRRKKCPSCIYFTQCGLMSLFRGSCLGTHCFPRLLPRELVAGGRSLQRSAFQGWSPGTRIETYHRTSISARRSHRRAGMPVLRKSRLPRNRHMKCSPAFRRRIVQNQAAVDSHDLPRQAQAESQTSPR